MIHQYILLSVPATQSRIFCDHITGNISNGDIVLIDALFGGLDVVARLKTNLHELIGKKTDTKEAAILEVNPIRGKPFHR